VQAIWNNWPWLIAMAVLIGCSAFFSASEAALFCLRWPDRRRLAGGTRSQRAAERLLSDPDRLLSAVLFWNLVINITYFAISSIVGLRLGRTAAGSQSLVFCFAAVSLLSIIFFSEMLPQSIAVLQPRALAGVLGLSIAGAVRLVDPVMPLLRTINLYSRRLIWPTLGTEPSLELEDIGRAIEVSEEDDQLVAQERFVLGNIVNLSTISAREWMSPRNKFRSLLPPISAADIAATGTIGGYAIVSQRDGADVAAAIPVRDLHEFELQHLERHAQDVAVVPWCASLAAVLESLLAGDHEVAAVVNELGEAIGIVTIHDVWDAVFSESGGRGERVLDRRPITQIRDDLWHVDGMTNLRRLSRYFEVQLPSTNHATLGGVIQETLERLPARTDRCRWGPFEFEVLEADQAGLLIAVQRATDGEESK
jgi:putative hemolysin